MYPRNGLLGVASLVCRDAPSSSSFSLTAPSFTLSSHAPRFPTRPTRRSLLCSLAHSAVDTLADAILEFANTPLGEGVDDEVWDAVTTIWAAPGVKKTYELIRDGDEAADDAVVPENAKFFLDQTADLRQPGYLPSDKFVIWLRRPTENPQTIKFMSAKYELSVTDVGGQDYLQIDWDKNAEGKDGLIYVLPIGDFDQMDQKGRNKLLLGMELFTKICNTPVFARSHVLLMLNKFDLFEEKYNKSPAGLKVIFPDAPDGASCEDALEFLSQKMRALTLQTQTCHTFTTTATDLDSMKAVLENVVAIDGMVNNFLSCF